MKKNPVLRNLLIDLLCTGAALIVFALFHHVLPRQQESMGIVIENPRTRITEESGGSGSGALELPEGAFRIASAGTDTITDAGASATAVARSGKNGGNGKSRHGGSGGGTNSNDKGGSALTESSETEDTGDSEASSETEASSESTAESFEDHFTDTVVTTENSYSSPDISITVSRETTADGSVTYYLADIYVRDVTCFRSALASDTYGSGFRDSISDMAALNNALLAINGDYYGNTSEGVVIRNGVIYRANPTDCDVCVLYYDGTMRVMPGSSFSVEEAIADGAWQAWTFGPALLNTDGSVLTQFSSSRRIISANPRTAIGYYEPGHYCMVVVDGRGSSAGITLPDLSRLFADLGCKAAYNLDGGNSSVMVWNSSVINDPSGGGRESSDALLIAEVNDDE